jgi:CheY-like chemotaxis protein
MKDNASYKVLMIEDNAAFLKIMKMRLESKGYRVVTAVEGLEGLSMARSQKPDLIISDIMLPRLDGHKLCRFVKFDQAMKHIPVIMLTSRDLDADAKIAKACRADAFIAKTTRAEVVLDVVEKLLN